MRMNRLLTAAVAATLAWSAHAVEIVFQPVAPNVYAHVGDLEGRTYENEAINTGGQDHRWLGNGYFKAQGTECPSWPTALTWKWNRNKP